MMKEIVAARAHIAEPGTKMKSFEKVAARLNANLRFQPVVNGRQISERLKTRMKSFITMRNADERASGVAYEYSEVEKILEDMKGQMDAAEELKRKEEESETDQRKKKEEAAKRILANATGGKRKMKEDEEDSDECGTPRGPKRQRFGGTSVESNNGLEAFGGSIEKSEAARLEFEHKRLESQQLMHREMIEERKTERAERRIEEERREKRDMERMKAFMEFSMNAIVTAVKEVTKKEQ